MTLPIVRLPSVYTVTSPDVSSTSHTNNYHQSTSTYFHTQIQLEKHWNISSVMKQQHGTFKDRATPTGPPDRTIRTRLPQPDHPTGPPGKEYSHHQSTTLKSHHGLIEQHQFNVQQRETRDACPLVTDRLPVRPIPVTPATVATVAPIRQGIVINSTSNCSVCDSQSLQSTCRQ